MAGIWSELLHVSQLRVGDNFFELGGHSLLATQLISRLRTAFSLELPLRLLFEVPTVAGQARAIEEALKGGAEVVAPPLLALADRTWLPLSFAQQRLWFLDQLEPGSTAYNMPTALRLSGELDVRALEQGLNEVVKRHEILRTVFVAGTTGPVQLVQAVKASKLAIFDLSELPVEQREAETRQLLRNESEQAFELSDGPLWRARLGGSHAGQKTMLDVFIPVQAVFSAGGDARAVKRAALAAAEATIPMRASRGRASFLGDRSIGHMDPGARSASLIIAAFCDELERCDG